MSNFQNKSLMVKVRVYAYFGEGIWWGGLFENSVSPGPETEMEYGFQTKERDLDLNLELDNNFLRNVQ